MNETPQPRLYWPSRRAELHVLAAAEEVGLGERDFGEEAGGGRIAAAEADRTRRLVFDLDGDDDPVGRRARPRRDVHLLEKAEPVEAALALFDHRVVVGVAFADVELAADHVIARAGVADDIDALDVDLRAVVDGEGDGDLVGRLVALAVRPHVGEGVALARQFARDRVDRLVDRGGVVDVAGVQLDERLQRMRCRPWRRCDVTVTPETWYCAPSSTVMVMT